MVAKRLFFPSSSQILFFRFPKRYIFRKMSFFRVFHGLIVVLSVFTVFSSVFERNQGINYTFGGIKINAAVAVRVVIPGS